MSKTHVNQSNKGKKVADHSIEDLLKLNAKQLLEVEFESEVDISVFEEFNIPHKLSAVSSVLLHFEFETEDDIRSHLMKFIAEKDLPLIGIKKRESSMEDVFNFLTRPEEDA